MNDPIRRGTGTGRANKMHRGHWSNKHGYLLHMQAVTVGYVTWEIKSMFVFAQSTIFSVLADAMRKLIQGRPS